MFDIERMKGTAQVEFWDLGDYKNRRLSHETVTEWPRTICTAWNWYGEDEIHFAAEWSKSGREGMLTQMWEAVDQADIIVGHNIQGFDVKKLNSEWRDVGMVPPSTYKIVDTLRETRKHFGDESKTLDALNKRLGIPAKTDKYDVELAKKALAGDRVAQLQIQAYNEGDIVASLELYDRIRGWMPNHPHLGLYSGEEFCCNQCGSNSLTRNGTTLANQITYILYRCDTCGGNVKGLERVNVTKTRGVS